MKKYIYFAAALAIVGAASCNKELVDNNAPEVPEVKLATLTATIGEPDTKTTLATPEGAHTNGSAIHWAADDALSVFDGTNNVEYAIKVEEGDTYTPATTAVFEGAALAETDGYYALYPYTADATLADGVIKGAVLPATQTAVAGNIPAGAALAVAYTEDRSEIHFKNVATIIGFTLTEAATEVSFVTKGEENIAGTIDVNFEEGLPTYTVQNETGSNKVTLENLEAGTYYFTILPDVTLTQGYEFYIGTELAKSNTNELTLVRSNIYSLGEVKVPLKDRGLSFSTTSFEITWGDDFTEPTLDGETDGVTYESSDPETVSVNTETGEVNILKAGTVTITATVAADETYNAGSAEYILTVNKANRNLVFSKTSATAKTEGEDFAEPTLSGEKTGVEYTSSNTTIATVDKTTGEIKALKAGTVTIIASAAANDTHNEGSVSYSLTVKEPSLWRLVGNFNGVDKWSKATGSIPMYATEQSNTFVAENVTLTSNDNWKFLYNDNWDDKDGGGWVGSYDSGNSDSNVYTTMQNHTSSNKYGSNHSYGSHKSNFGATAGTYDIYLEVGDYYKAANVWVVKK